jgi:RND family efflux transporter MFP subunit
MTENRLPEANQHESGHAPPGSRLFVSLLGAVIVLILSGGFTLLERRSQLKALASETERLAVPTVAVTHARLEPDQEDLILPSTLQAYVESPIYARTTGYLKKWYYDIGSHVQKGALLADIDAPEVDQELSQARENLHTSMANVKLSKITASRYTGLLKSDSVSKQEVDNAMGDFAAKTASVRSAEANVRRLQDLESFKHIVAPFSGVLTRRNIDVGHLINAGNGGQAQELFYLAQTDPVRAFVSVPEAYSPAIRVGLEATLELAQYAGQSFKGKVVRTAEAIDLSSRTLNTEIDVANPDGKLLPGGFAQVHLSVKGLEPRLQIPVNALLFRSEGLRTVVVDADRRTHLRALLIGRDYGTSLEVLQGLSADDWFVVNPADSLEEGIQVNVKPIAQLAAVKVQTGDPGWPPGAAGSDQAQPKVQP